VEIGSGHVGGAGGCADGLWAEADRLSELGLGDSHAVTLFASLHLSLLRIHDDRLQHVFSCSF
jgi:hypothetical protein